MLKSSHLKQGDLLIAIVGATIGEIGIYNHEREGNINQAIALVRLSDEVISSFAKEFFKSSIGKFILDRAKRPVARANINLDEIGALPIPVPSLDKQKEIADHISDIRNQAQTLKDKTKEALTKASEEIEEILLN
jgi:restriction endonuclease S subunit